MTSEVLSTETKFTPGPWDCNEVRTQIGRAFRIGKGAMLEPGPKGCCIIYDDYGHGKNEREANAHLIAAAPDLYAALIDARALLVADGFRPGSSLVVTNIDAALLKARGGSSNEGE